MSIYGQLQQYAAHGWIELFELDLTKFGDIVYRFHDGQSPLGQAIVWQGQEYTPYPVKVDGFA
ncbi:phage minor tail protein L, partial [Pasteurella multocida]|nr:phage minor tail protein L [Pasteurella multocida]MDY0661045.1 phage minor tail protein L [Pasteurella multocida]MDY0689153.1 phage minor tail protein L [Pasteurella multocida]